MKDNPGVPFGRYPQSTPCNPSQIGMRKSASPSRFGMDGKAGAPPVFPGAIPCSPSSEMSTKVRPTIPRHDPDTMPLRQNWTDTR
jgi:hypothetical protein